MYLQGIIQGAGLCPLPVKANARAVRVWAAREEGGLVFGSNTHLYHHV